MSSLYSFDELMDPNYVMPENAKNAEIPNFQEWSRQPIQRLTNANIHVRGDAWCSMPFSIFDIYCEKMSADRQLRLDAGTDKEAAALSWKKKKDIKYSNALREQYPDIWNKTYACINCGKELTEDELVKQALGKIVYKGEDWSLMGWSTSETCTECAHNIIA